MNNDTKRPDRDDAPVAQMVKTPVNRFLAIVKIFLSVISIISLIGIVRKVISVDIPLFRYNFGLGLLGLANDAVTVIQTVFSILIGIGVFRTVFFLSAAGADMAAANLKRTVVMTIIMLVLSLVSSLIKSVVAGGAIGFVGFLIGAAIVIGVIVLYYKYMMGWSAVLSDVSSRILTGNMSALPLAVSIKGPAITMASLFGVITLLVTVIGAEAIKAALVTVNLPIDLRSAGWIIPAVIVCLIIVVAYYICSAVSYGAYFSFCRSIAKGREE